MPYPDLDGSAHTDQNTPADLNSLFGDRTRNLGTSFHLDIPPVIV